MPRPTPPTRSAGFSLIELLVALIVVSLGLGGILYSQARGMQALNGNSWRAQAAVLAEHVIDRARANPTQAYTVDFGASPSGGNVASADLTTWKAQLARNLPAGDGRITMRDIDDAPSGRTFQLIDVTVSWDDQRAGASDETGPQPRYLRIQGYRVAP